MTIPVQVNTNHHKTKGLWSRNITFHIRAVSQSNQYVASLVCCILAPLSSSHRVEHPGCLSCYTSPGMGRCEPPTVVEVQVPRDAAKLSTTGMTPRGMLGIAVKAHLETRSQQLLLRSIPTIT